MNARVSSPVRIVLGLSIALTVVGCNDGGVRSGEMPLSTGDSDENVVDSASSTFDDDARLYWGFFPATLDAAYARGVYDAWAVQWVKACGDGSLRVEWDTAGKTVSEGIGYGMLLAAIWSDRVTFDGLLAYYKSHLNQNGLMGWLGSCAGNEDHGAATDADLDVAMALLLADCYWPDGSYGADATSVITALKGTMMKTDGDHLFQCAGDTWGDDCCGNASYQTPSYYRVFARHTGDSAYWEQAADDTYYYLDKYSNASTGLVSDWMTPDTLQCNAKSAGDWHGWDASRVPWRVTLDYLWWGNDRALAYGRTVASFVQNQGGVAQTCAGYNLAGTQCGELARTTFAGAFAATGMTVDQATADAFFEDLKGVSNTGYFDHILNALYMATAAGQFTAGCY